MVGVLFVGGSTIRTGSGITPGQTMAAITYLSLILMRIVFLANIFQTFTRASASWKRICEVLTTESAQKSGKKEPLTGSTGEIEFRHVSFAYPNAPENRVLEDISFSVRKGETVAVIGSTGCGKSSLVSLIPRFYDATKGTVLVDGQDVRDMDLKTLRAKIGMVQQKAELFSGSILENICWGSEEKGESEARQASRIAQAEDFILRMPDGYGTFVSEGGHSLSGGQNQRISISRALIKHPEILILDDSGSALDLKTEAAFYDALNREFADTTKMIVAQRIASVRQADRILVLDNGRICATGTHEELLQSSAVYQEICRSQLKKEAIA